MSIGQYRTKRRGIPWVAFVLLLVAVLSLGTGTVYAYLRANATPVENQFSAANDPDPDIEDAYAVNVGDPGYSVYVRSVIVVTWQDADGKVLGQAPVRNTDYSLELNTDWFEHAGFYYYRKPISNGAVSPVKSFQQLKENEGYTLHVEIVAQTIQALGTTDGNNPIPAVTDAWGIPVSGGELEDPS